LYKSTFYISGAISRLRSGFAFPQFPLSGLYNYPVEYTKTAYMRFVDIGGIVDHHCFSFLS
jgi:hypothetical protein